MLSLLFIVLSYIAGILFFDHIPVIIQTNIFFLSILLFLLSFFEYKIKNTKFLFILSLCLISFLIGIKWYSYSIPKTQNNDISYFIPQKGISLEATIIEEPKKDDNKISLKVKSDLVIEPFISLVNGYSIVNIYDNTLSLEYGDKIQIDGDLDIVPNASNPDEFSYSDYVAKQGVFSFITAKKITIIENHTLDDFQYMLINTRKNLLSTLYQSMPESSASIIGSLVFGAKATPVPKNVRDEFTSLGLSHVLAASGMQITLIMGTGLLLIRLTKINRLLGICLIIPSIVFYMFLTGLPPSILRAGLLNILILLIQYKRESADTYKVLFFVSSGIIIVNPLALFDIGFQFSVLATFGLLYISKILEDKLNFLPIFLSSIVAMILAAQIMVLPLQLYHFGQFSYLFLLANLIASLFVDLLTYISILTLIIGKIFPFISYYFGTLLYYILSVFLYIIDYISLLPVSVSYMKRPEIHTVIFLYLLIFTIIEFFKEDKLKIDTLKQKKYLAMLSGLIILFSLDLYRYDQTTNLLEVNFINVSQGDSTLIVTPDKQTILIDCGQAYQRKIGDKIVNYNAAEKYILPYLRHKGIKTIDKLVLTHPDLDHIGGCETILDNFHIKEIWDSGQTDDSQAYSQLLTKILEKNIPIKVVNYNDNYEEKNLKLKVINKIDVSDTELKSYNNNYAIALRLDYGKNSFLFMSDLEKEAEEQLLNSYEDINSDVLKVGHHGSNTSTTDEFMLSVRPQYAVISAGKNNRYKHPRKEVLERLNYFGSKIYRTDQDGGVIFTSDGNKLNITTSK